MKNNRLIKLVMTSLFTAMVCVATVAVHVPIPATQGYVNLGDALVLLGAFFLGPWYGAAAAAVGSALADLFLGYAVYAPGTLLVKGLTALAAGLIMKALRHRTKAASLPAGLVGEAVMILGYFAYEGVVLGFGFAAAASIPANAAQGAAGLILSVALYRLLSSIPQLKDWNSKISKD